MRPTRALLAAIALAPCAQAAISLDPTQTSWAGIDVVSNFGSSNGTTIYAGQKVYSINPVVAGPPMGAAITMSQGSTFLTLMEATPMVGQVLTPTPELAGSNLAAGTPVHLTYTGLTSMPSYVALMGGDIQSYAYNSATGTLSITAKTGKLAATASNSGPGAVSDALALVIETNPAYDFGGSVFRTDAYWGDLTNLNGLYPGSSPLVGLNVNGLHGSTVTFDAYLTTAYLASIGINSRSDVIGYVQKAGTSFEVALMTTLMTVGGFDPHFDGVLYDQFGGASSFDINGGGLDDVIKATYANSSWSSGNIGLLGAAPIPEPSTYGLSLGGLALVGAVIRRRRSKVSK